MLVSRFGVCRGFTIRGHRPCTKQARENGYCVSHGGIETCLGINDQDGHRCRRPPNVGTLYCTGHTKISVLNIDTTAEICQGTFRHGEKCTRPAHCKGMCGYHIKNIKSSELGIIHSTNKCPLVENCANKKLINGVCTDHQGLLYYNELVSQGKKICANWHRNCFNETNGTFKCEKCFEDQYSKTINTFESVDEFNKLNISNGIKQCVRCFFIKPIGNFLSNNNYIKLCSNCTKIKANNKGVLLNKRKNKTQLTEKQNSENEKHKNDVYKIIEERSSGVFLSQFQEKYQLYETNSEYKYNTYKLFCEHENIKFQLTLEKAEKLFLDRCFYCGYVGNDKCLNEIDLMGYNLGYEDTNCVSCCNICNNIKHLMSPEIFIYIIRHILNNLHLINTDESFSEFFEDFGKITIDKYKKISDIKMIEFELTSSDFEIFTSNPCYICGKKSTNNGIDRFDNSIGYTLNNVEACCKTCNYMKRNMSYEYFIDKLVDIYYNNLLFDDSTILDANKIEELKSKSKISELSLTNNNIENFDIDFNIFSVVNNIGENKDNIKTEKEKK